MAKTFLNKIDLAIIFLLNLLFILFVSIPSFKESPLRIILGLSLVIFLPGYSLVAALFPRRNDLDWIEQITLSFGLSIVIVPLFGFGLNYTPFGIRLIPLLILISTFTICLSLIAWVRRLKLPVEERFRVPLEILFKAKEFLGETAGDKILSIILVISIIASSGALVYVISKPKTGESFTEFYLLGQNGTAYDYPINLNIGEEGKVIIGIVNHEYENMTYRLEFNFNGILIHKKNIFLVDNEKWEESFIFKAINKEKNQKLEFLLYKYQQKEAYRKIHIWISVE